MKLYFQISLIRAFSFDPHINTPIQRVNDRLLHPFVQTGVQRIDPDHIVENLADRSPISGTGYATIVKLRSSPLIYRFTSCPDLLSYKRTSSCCAPEYENASSFTSGENGCSPKISITAGPANCAALLYSFHIHFSNTSSFRST